MKKASDTLAPADPEESELDAARKDHKLAAAYLDKHPTAVGAFGSAASIAQSAWVVRHAPKDAVMREALYRNVERLCADLLGPTPSKLEKMLVTRIAVCWLQVHYFDISEAMGGERSLAACELGLKRQDRAHRRYLSALKTLAEVRRLVVPAVQVNIAERQVNVASAVGGMPETPEQR